MSATPTMLPPPCKAAFSMTVSYSEAKKMANGSCVKSNPIDVGGHSWRIVFYPNGSIAGSDGFMSLFLLLDATADDEDVHVKLRLMMHEVGGRTATFASAEVADAFSQRYKELGYECFVSREDFEKSALFESDRFKIRCDLTVFPLSVVKEPPPAAPPLEPSAARAAPPSSPRTPPPEPSVERATPPPPPSGLHADLGRLLETKEGADVEIEVGGKVFAAHKSVLAARSSVFMVDFFGPTKEEDTSYVRIGDDMRPEAFEALLHYMYTDSLPEMTMDSLEGAVLAEDLLMAADWYDLKDLKSLTENKLCSHVGVRTVLVLLALAELNQCCMLKKMCLGFIGSSSIADAREIVESDHVEILASISPSAVKDVITEILDTRDERFWRLINFCIYAFCFFLPFVVFAFL